MTHHFDPVILRDYDIRGTVGDNLGAADAYAIGRGFATRLRRGGEGAAGGHAGPHRVVVGYDGRTHSPLLETALVQGLIDSGVDVVRIGLCPSPMLYFAGAV